MKKIVIIFITILLIVGGGIWFYNSNKSNNEKANQISNYQAEKSSTNTNQNNTSNISTNNSNKEQNNTQNNNIEKTPNETKIEEKKEIEISNFTTKIYNKDKERQNNITITCKALNSKIIEPGETFSFCSTVGKSTSSKGYQEADIYVDGEKKQGLGGGNCQVSTTLYNAVAKIPELEIVERHKHSGHVPYIQDGKDAAVAYGSYDFKFKNNTGNIIRIEMENNKNNITARIIKII